MCKFVILEESTFYVRQTGYFLEYFPQLSKDGEKSKRLFL